MASLRRVVPIASAWLLFTVLQQAGLGQNPLSVSKPEADNSVKAELASFAVDKQLQINLFADESMGIANPICMRWDGYGRLWVLCTWAYPQLKPGEKPNDKLLILEDTNDDAKADKISTYIDGLNMPTGFALGHGGAYIGNGRELLHGRDTTGDGKADERVVLFSGFGTGDTHQTINSFEWSPGGELFFSQGLHCFSRVQTPWGIRKLDEHGSWRLRPLRRQLHPHRRTSGGGNPWGFAFGNWGEPFIKSNGPGVSELLPGMIVSEKIVGDYWGGAVQIGATKIKSMIIEIVDTPVLPKNFQGDFLIAGYFARNIARLRPTVDGAGHKLQTLAPILTSTHNAFRPVDLNTGPDGALYVADWFNPIIGHYQASLRHPDRDKVNGRIWRITTKGKTLLPLPPAEAGGMSSGSSDGGSVESASPGKENDGVSGNAVVLLAGRGALHRAAVAGPGAHPPRLRGRQREQRLAFGCNPPNATVYFVTVRMSQRGLVMADDRVEPIGDIQCTIGAGIEVHGAKSVVSGSENGC